MPLKIELTPDAQLIKVHLPKYSEVQPEVLTEFVDKVICNGMVYRNATSPWACASLLMSSPGPSRFWFTADLRPVNKYTVKRQYATLT